MIAVGAPAKTDQQFQDEAFTRTFIEQKLEHWREMLAEALAGNSNVPGEADCRRALNTWLDELCSLAELRWVPTPEEDLRLSNGWRN